MKDRIPGAPGQYKAVVTEEQLLKMQSGEEFTITMTRDDQPIEEGTPYSKAAVLPDALAQQLCPDIENPTPADAFDALANRMKAKAGFIYPLATEVVPDGFLLCDGAEYGRDEYPELFAAIGTMYGEGDGNTTFNVPNLATRVPVGVGEGYALGDTGGEAEHTLTFEQIPSVGVNVFREKASTSDWGFHAEFTQVNTASDNAATFNSGHQPVDNMQPYTVVNYIIATGKDTAVSVSDIVLGAQAIPLAVQYGGTGATNRQDACKNIEALHAIESTEHPGCYYRMVDGEQEWINPPLVIGEEYRTSERCGGKPVYTKVVDFGALPSAGTIKQVEHSATPSQMLRAYGRIVASPAGGGDTIPYYDASYGDIRITATLARVKIATVSWTNSLDITTMVAHAQIYYIKD